MDLNLLHMLTGSAHHPHVNLPKGYYTLKTLSILGCSWNLEPSVAERLIFNPLPLPVQCRIHSSTC